MKAAAKRFRFTKAAIEALEKPKTGRTYFYDAKTPGLALCVTSTGTRTFYVYRKVDGKPERIRVGPWPDLNVEQARRQAARINGTIAKGRNPNDRRRDTRNAPTLRELFDVFIESSVEGMRKPDPRIYELACSRLGVVPGESVFLDDIGANLKPARRLGFTTIKVDEPGAALAELASVLGFPFDDAIG